MVQSRIPPIYGPRARGIGDVVPASSSDESPTLTGEVVDRLPDAPQDAPPSSYAVADFLRGDDGSAVRLAGLTLLRTVFIFPGIFVANKITGTEMGFGKIAGYSLATSTSITAGMLAYYSMRRRFPSRARAQGVAT